MEDIKTWTTREEAQNFADKLDGFVYHLRHGEYDRPDYKVRKIRGQDVYGIWMRFYFYPGTFNARKDGYMNSGEAWYYENWPV